MLNCTQPGLSKTRAASPRHRPPFRIDGAANLAATCSSESRGWEVEHSQTFSEQSRLVSRRTAELSPPRDAWHCSFTESLRQEPENFLGRTVNTRYMSVVFTKRLKREWRLGVLAACTSKHTDICQMPWRLGMGQRHVLCSAVTAGSLQVRRSFSRSA